MGLTYISVTIGVLIAVACAWYTRRLAADKGRNVIAWTLAGFVLTLVAVPVLVLLPGARRAESGAPGDDPRARDADESPPARGPQREGPGAAGDGGAEPAGLGRASRLDGPT